MDRNKNIMVAIMLGVILTMAVGYAVLQQRLNITGTSNITSNFSVKFTGIESTPTGGASNKTTPIVTNTTATFNVNLVNPGDVMTYDITVTNAGTIDTELAEIKMTDSSNTAIEFNYSGIEVGEDLLHGESKTFKVTAKYSDSVTTQPGTLASDLNITLNYSDQMVADGADGTINTFLTHNGGGND